MYANLLHAVECGEIEVLSCYTTQHQHQIPTAAFQMALDSAMPIWFVSTVLGAMFYGRLLSHGKQQTKDKKGTRNVIIISRMCGGAPVQPIVMIFA